MAGMCCLLAASISSCVKDDWVNPNGDKALNLTICVSGMDDKAITRAGEVYSSRTDRSTITYLDVVLANREKVERILNFQNGTQTIGADNFEETGLISGTFPITPVDGITTGIKFRIGKTDMKNVTDIYLVANYINEGGTLSHLRARDVQTVTALNDLKQGTPTDLTAGALCTMFGHINMITDQPVDSDEQQKNYTVSLERTLAMITLAIDGAELADGVVITPVSARLVNVPQTCTINGNYTNRANASNRAGKGQEILSLNRSWAAVCNQTTAGKLGEENQPVVPYAWPEGFSWGDVENGNIANYIAANGPHGTGEAVFPLFMFENEQGTYGETNTNEKDKKPATDNQANCSYIEVKAAYQHSTQLGGSDGVGNRFGNITYKFWLGADVTSDFNVERNKHYMLTLKLKGLGGLEEDGRLNTDGSWNATAEGGASWRVTTSFSNSGIVDSDVLEVPANGSRVDLVLAGYPTPRESIGNNVHFVFSGGKNNPIWLYSPTNNNWIEAPGNKWIGDYLIENPDGTYTIRIYLKPVGTTEFNGIYYGTITGAGGSTGQAPLNTVEKWTQYGYRQLSFSIKGFSDNTLNRTIPVKQWLPMPVMESGTNPYDQTLFFSRFDIYHGEMLSWCHEGMHAMNLLPPTVDENTLLRTDELNIADNGTSQTYNRENGFHKTVAFFRTNIYNNMQGQISFNDALPQTMMAYAFYAAANAETASSGMFVQTPDAVTSLTHYGLPSVEEWERIEKNGKFDSRYPITAGVQYWSSTVYDGDGTKSMVYMMGTGKAGATPAERSRKHLGRLVYRKNITATPDKTAKQ